MASVVPAALHIPVLVYRSLRMRWSHPVVLIGSSPSGDVILPVLPAPVPPPRGPGRSEATPVMSEAEGKNPVRGKQTSRYLGQVRAPFAGELPMLQTSHLTLSGKSNVLSIAPIIIIRWDGVEVNGTEALSLLVVARTDSQDWVLHS